MATDWETRRRAYDATSIDWTHLRPYAAKIAAELSTAFPGKDRWLLDSRSWTKVEHSGGNQETTEARYYCELRSDGRLVSRRERWEEQLTSRGQWSRDDYSESEEELTDRVAVLFDFSKELRRHHSGGAQIDTELDPGRRLLVHAKGSG